MGAGTRRGQGRPSAQGFPTGPRDPLILRLLAPSQRHSWDTAGTHLEVAKGARLLPRSRPWRRQPPSPSLLPPPQIPRIPAPLGAWARLGTFLKLGMCSWGRKRGGPASVLTFGRLQWSRSRPRSPNQPMPWCMASYPLNK